MNGLPPVGLATAAADWRFPVATRFGPGRIRELPGICKEHGLHRPLLVTDSGLATLPIVTDQVAALRAAGIAVEVFDAIKSNPTMRSVEAARARFKSDRHDAVIAMGGGSAIDAGKALAHMARNDLPFWAFEWGGETPPPDLDPMAAFAPIIIIPTTSGTGSEMDGSGSVITDEDSQRKRAVFHPRQRHLVTLCDPELTHGLPPDLTAWTGLDAVSHAIEGLSVPAFHPMCDAIGTEALRRIAEWLPAAVSDGRNAEARAQMQVAASMAAVTFQKGLGACHALSHCIGGAFDTHHGLTNAVLLPYVMELNRAHIAAKFDPVARTMGLIGPAGDGYGAVLQWLVDLRADLGIPHTLQGLGIDRAARDVLAERALLDAEGDTNPAPLSLEVYAELFDRAWEGRLDGL